MGSHGATALQFWFRFDSARWSRFGSDLVQVQLGLAQGRFTFGSDLGRLDTTSVQIWFRFCHDLVRVWFGLEQWPFRFGGGSHLVQIWIGLTQSQGRFVSGSVMIWFAFGSAWSNGRSDLVQVRPGSVQRRVSFGSGVARLGP